MELLRFVWYDYVIFVLLVSVSIAIGLYYGIFDKSNTGISDYFHGGRRLKVFPTSVSLIASCVSVADLLAIPAEIYVHGTQYWVALLSIPVMALIVNYLYLPVMYKLNVTTSLEYFGLRYNSITRTATTIAFICILIIYTPVLIFTPALALSQVSGFNAHHIMWIITVICIFYTTIGGFKAVIWSDTLQFVITVSTLFISLIMGVVATGGLEKVWKLATDGKRIEFFRMDPNPTVRATFWSVFVGNIFYWITLTSINPTSTQRLFSVEDFKSIQRVFINFCIGTVITKSIIYFLGLVVYARYFNCDPMSVGLVERSDQMIPYFVLDTVKEVPGLSVLFISGLFSMSFSVLSTFLNTLAYLMYSGLVLPMFPKMSDKRSNYVTKGLTVLIGLTCLALVYVIEKLRSILETTYTLCGLLGGTLTGLLLLGLIFPSANTKGAYGGGIASVLIMAFIVFKSNYYIWTGDTKYETKPFRTDGCHMNFTFENTNYANSTSLISSENSQPHWIFRLSFHYYSGIGASIVILVGLLISLITRRIHNPPLKEELISPITYRLFNRMDKLRYHLPINDINIVAEE